MTALITRELQFPTEVSEQQVLSGLLATAGSSATSSSRALRFSARGSAGGISHQVQLGQVGASAVLAQWQAAVPGLQLAEVVPRSSPLPHLVWKLWLSNSRRPLSTDRAESISRSVLTALSAPMAAQESVSLQWLLVRVERARAVGTRQSPFASESWGRALLTAPLQAPGEPDADARKALRSKYSYPAWRCTGLIVVQARSRTRAQQLAAPVLAALRTAEGPSSYFGIRRASPQLLTRPPLFSRLLLSVPELVGLLAWPIKDAGRNLQVRQRRARLLPPPRQQDARGRLLGRSLIGDAPVRLGERDAEAHLVCLGPTGTGKTSWLVGQILASIDAGHNVIALDSKGQLTDLVLSRFPEQRRDQLVVFGAGGPAPVGLNPFASQLDPALVADQLLGLMRNLYSDSWGVRTADVLGAALQTLARTAGTSLACLPLLLTNHAYRRHLVGSLDDPLGLGEFWSWYDGLSSEQRSQIIAPSLNKIRPFLTRPSLRAILGQSQPGFDLLDVFTKPRVVLADLGKGTLGPEGSALLGSTLLSLLFQATLTRANVPDAQLRPVRLFIDEAQDFLRLADLSQFLEQARSTRVAVCIAHQQLGQLNSTMRDSVLANARSRVLFQLTSNDAHKLADGHPELTPTDLTSLAPYETYMSLMVNGGVTPYASVRSLPLAPATRDPAQLRQRAASRYGHRVEDTEADLRALVQGGTAATPAERIGARPRRSNS